MIRNSNIFELEELVDFNKDKELEVATVVRNTIEVIRGRGSNVCDKQKEQLKAVTSILSNNLVGNSPIVVPMEMGLGKSTLLEEFLKHKVSIDKNFGAIVVKERIEDILELEKRLEGKAKAVYSFYEDHCIEGVKDYNRMTLDRLH